MRSKLLNLLFLLFFMISYGQQEITWKDLSKVSYTDKYFPEYDDYFKYPNFSSSVKALDGKRIVIKGYFLDIGIGDDVFMLSKGPMSSCFFCGQGGPETAIEIKLHNSKNFKTDAIVSITGILKLNKDDVDHFNYILTNCEATLIE